MAIPTFGKRTQPPDREHPCSYRANPCIHARVLLYVIALCDYAKIIRYNLRSVSFSLEGVKIPAFMGDITIKMNGTQTMANFARMLFLFGTYAGVGIKTSLGMGSIQLIQRKGGSTC